MEQVSSDGESEAERETGSENSGYDGSRCDGSRVRSECETRWVNAREDCEQRRMKGNDKWKEWCVWAQAAHFPVGDCHGRGKEKGRDLRSEGDGKIVNM
ncbi:hypothetical protein V6N13_110886 [Hibiscus sabdariffa]